MVPVITLYCRVEEEERRVDMGVEKRAESPDYQSIGTLFVCPSTLPAFYFSNVWIPLNRLFVHASILLDCANTL